MFTAVTLKRVRDYIMAHLDEPLDVATLAAMCGRSQFHFSRVFARSVGVSPYQYVLHLRVKRAVQLICERRLALAPSRMPWALPTKPISHAGCAVFMG